MALSDILDACVAVLTDAGIVRAYPYQPVMTAAAQLPSTLKDAGIVHFWSVTREGTTEARLTNRETQRNHTLVLRGYYEIGDASTSEPVFQALIETVMADFRALYSFAAPASVEWLTPPQASAIGPRTLNETFLVHYVEIRLDAQERVTP